MANMDLSTFNNDDFDRGASRAKELAWLVVSALFVAGPIPGSRWREAILRAFGARIETGVVFKPRVIVKFPWRLEIGANSWIGEGVWIDNLAEVRIGKNVCISQDAYLCTGNHDWTSPAFILITGGITIEDQCWVGARATLAPGTHMLTGAVLGLGAVGHGILSSWTVYAAGNQTEICSRRHKHEDRDE
jgi:putative colanic acid biosynthesis acetyltransferase WcaF